MKIIAVAGARPNFMKIAPLLQRARSRPNLHVRLVHTGQHYDAKMSETFFEELNIPQPDFQLGVGSASHAVQTAEVMKRFEPVLQHEAPDAVVVVGDVNSTLACALTAVKMGIPVGHVEAGLRSFDRTMPEEINRILTDAISRWLLVSERSGLFPVHPRTRKSLNGDFPADTNRNGSGSQSWLRLTEPLGYLEFLKLMAHARMVLTDSGGIQEETTALGVPCLTLRTTTERPVTITEGTNVLVGLDPQRIVAEGLKALHPPRSPARLPELWDGEAANRILDVLTSS
jgi:UDP-N-acetylglucosamine 2-epimerase